MGALLSAVLPLIIPLISKLFSPTHQPTGTEAEEFPRPAWLPSKAINWAVTGQSGAGKSAFVNGMRNVKRGDKGWAPEGVSETTMDPIKYPFPQANEAIIWDLPGGNTTKHPGITYAKDKGIRWFHGVVICIKDGRPTEFDIGLVAILEEYGVPYYVVQNRFQHACEGEDVDIDDKDEVKKLASKVKGAVHTALTEGGARTCSFSRTFMINSRKWKFADGEALKDTLMQDVLVGKPAEPPSKRARR